MSTAVRASGCGHREAPEPKPAVENSAVPGDENVSASGFQQGAAARRVEPGKPFTYKDPKTGILLYVESDNRHVTAIDPDGKILWERDIIKEENISQNYRKDPITVYYLGPLSQSDKRILKEHPKNGDYVGIGFKHSGEGGVLNQRTGEYWCLGSL
jgi:hypothetical protein